MIIQNKNGFTLPDLRLTSLPTGSVKDLVNTLGSSVINGEFAVGENIPMEPALVAEHEVSRTVVREAIKVLSGKGLVRTARRYGTRVCAFDEWNLLDPDVILWHRPNSPMTRRIIDDAACFRFKFQPAASAFAAVHAKPAQRELLVSASEVITKESEASEKRLAADFAFHATILESSGCSISRHLRGFVYAITRYTYEHIPDALAGSIADPSAYKNTADAIIDGDDQLASSRMMELLASINSSGQGIQVNSV